MDLELTLDEKTDSCYINKSDQLDKFIFNPGRRRIMNSIGVLDVGIGNTLSIIGCLSRLGATSQLIHYPEELKKVTHLIIPGVGNMKSLTNKLKVCGIDKEIKEFAKTKYLLGICLGFQLLFEGSEEGDVSCLGLLPGRVLSLSRNLSVSTNVGYHEVKNISSSIIALPAA